MMERRAIRSIVVVGGGTAGWLSAHWLARALRGDGSDGSSDERAVRCSITLIESPRIPTVGVGEATIDSLPGTLEFLGIDESTWMRDCQATFKLAVKFVNWSGGGREDVFWHPFGEMAPTSERQIPPHQSWLGARVRGDERNFYTSCFENVELCHQGKAPRRWGFPSFVGDVDYGYQLDAALFAEHLRSRGPQAGIRHVLDTVEDVMLDQDGFIRQVVTGLHGEIAGDLFLDCTGFRSRLLGQALDEPFVDYSQALFCDRAVAIQTPRDEATVEPYTTSTALSAGWAWKTPLVRRDGNGYVYCSSFLSPQQAEDELRAVLGDAAVGAEARHIRMRVGKARNSWVKNCVAIGLAGGFVEPLESTGIALIELGLEYLLYHFPDRRFEPAVIQHYNDVMTQYYEEIRDFLVLHYCITRRRDTPFWRANAEHPAIPDSLQEKLDIWRVMWPNNPEPPGLLFPDYSYACILAGHDRLPGHPLPCLAYLDLSAVTRSLTAVSERARRKSRALPGHDEYLRILHGG